MSWLYEHPDHIALGQALRTLNNEGSIPNGDSRFESPFASSPRRHPR